MLNLQQLNAFTATAWDRIQPLATKVGKRVLEQMLVAYYLLIDPQTSTKVKITVGGALAYLLLPLDIIPDFIPGGFADDGAALGAALYAVATSIKPEHKAQALAQMQAWGLADVQPPVVDVEQDETGIDR